MATLSQETSISRPAAVVAMGGEPDLAGAAALEHEPPGRRLALIPGSVQVMPVFEISRMPELLELVDDPREATGAP